MIKAYPKFKRGQIARFYSTLSAQEKKIIENYIKFRVAKGVSTKDKQDDIKRYILHFRYIVGKPFKNLTNQDILDFTSLLVESNLSTYAKNDIRINLKSFLKWNFNNWSSKFPDIEHLLKTKQVSNEAKINHNTILKKSEIEKIVKNEHRTFWKAFFLVQYEGGLRTKETRYVKWSDINLNADGDISEINIYATKTKRARTIFVKDATYFLNLLKSQQEHEKTKGEYVFRSPQSKEIPISKSAVNKWFRTLSKKVLGRKCWNYLLRHSRSSELYSLANQNKISDDTAMRVLGHKKSMKETYTHLNPTAIKEVIKKQLYDLEDLPPEKKEEYEERIKDLEAKFEKLAKHIVGKGSIKIKDLSNP